jgi:hypothetical protein
MSIGVAFDDVTEGVTEERRWRRGRLLRQVLAEPSAISHCCRSFSLLARKYMYCKKICYFLKPHRTIECFPFIISVLKLDAKPMYIVKTSLYISSWPYFDFRLSIFICFSNVLCSKNTKLSPQINYRTLIML